MASALTRWDPIQEFAALRNTVDRLFEQGFARFPALPLRGGEDLGPTTLSLDVYETANAYVVKSAIPGINPTDVEVAVEDDVLTIRGETRQDAAEEEASWIRRELRYGRFERMLRLPPTVDPEKATATFEHGVLKLTLPKKAEARARSIKITPQSVIEGASAE